MSVDMPATRISREDGFLPVCEAEADCASSSPSCALSAGRSFVPGPARGATPARAAYREGAATVDRVRSRSALSESEAIGSKKTPPAGEGSQTSR